MNRDFKGIWIPREIWLNKNISLQAKVLWAEIFSLHDRESGGCYASNEYLCEFMNVKISRLKEIMKELRDIGFLKEVSFNGRNRIIRAEMPAIDYGGQQTAGKPAPCQPENCQADSRDSGIPTYSIEQSLVTTLDSPPIPPQKSKVEKAAKAAEIEKVPSSKPKREKPDFSPKVREVANQIINSLIRTKPDYVPPKNLSALLTEVDFILRLDGRDPIKLMDVFNWALADSFWADKMFKPNPAKYLREKFDQLEMKMNAKPEPSKKERRFAASSNHQAAMEAMEEMNKRAL